MFKTDFKSHQKLADVDSYQKELTDSVKSSTRTVIMPECSLSVSRYLDGMEQALQGKFKRQFVEHQILVFMAMEIIAWYVMLLIDI